MARKPTKAKRAKPVAEETVQSHCPSCGGILRFTLEAETGTRAPAPPVAPTRSMLPPLRPLSAGPAPTMAELAATIPASFDDGDED